MNTPVPYIRCTNCFGTGTVFTGKTTLKIGGKRCPVCKGKTKIPVQKESK